LERTWYDWGVAWDSSRPVPWKRLLALFAVYAVIANVALVLFARDRYSFGSFAGMLSGMVLYLGIAWVLVKFGWNPPSLRPGQAAREGAARRAARATERPETRSTSPSPSRAKPPPTRRTNATNRRARRR